MGRDYGDFYRRRRDLRLCLNKGARSLVDRCVEMADLMIRGTIIDRPLVRGGRSSKGNCVAACKDCNTRKRDMLPTEWQDYLDNLA